ncbi:MAG TPA: hypothetical protein VGF86_08960 [Candidatus Tumulicola sp.]|jgi:hypothetical protein
MRAAFGAAPDGPVAVAQGHATHASHKKYVRKSRIVRYGLLVIAAVAAASAGAAADPAQTPGSNVTVTTCHAQLDKPPLRIAYTNVAAQTAVEVDFTVVGPVGAITSVRDIGKFATGTPINHVFDLPPDTSPLGLSSAKCTVTKVRYADGTSWVNPNSP